MRRLSVVVVVAAVAAAAFATGALAAPTAGPSAATAPSAKAATLPPLPANIRARKRWIIGVKCDTPPFGYINVRGENAGFDIEIAKWFSRYAFGRATRVTYVCAPTPAREPLLTTDRVDLVISTFTYTPDRATRIDFSRAYYRATGRLLVRNDGPVQSLRDLSGRTVSTTSGSIYDRWIRRCFPNTNLIVTSSFTDALLAFRDGRADAMMWDDTALVGQAAAERAWKLTNDTFLALPYGIGIKKGNAALKRWVDSRLELMRRADRFLPILQTSVPARFVPSFSRNILRPRVTFGYNNPNQPSPETVCP